MNDYEQEEIPEKESIVEMEDEDDEESAKERPKARGKKKPTKNS